MPQNETPTERAARFAAAAADQRAARAVARAQGDKPAAALALRRAHGAEDMAWLARLEAEGDAAERALDAHLRNAHGITEPDPAGRLTAHGQHVAAHDAAPGVGAAVLPDEPDDSHEPPTDPAALVRAAVDLARGIVEAEDDGDDRALLALAGDAPALLDALAAALRAATERPVGVFSAFITADDGDADDEPADPARVLAAWPGATSDDPAAGVWLIPVTPDEAADALAWADFEVQRGDLTAAVSAA